MWGGNEYFFLIGYVSNFYHRNSRLKLTGNPRVIITFWLLVRFSAFYLPAFVKPGNNPQTEGIVLRFWCYSALLSLIAYKIELFHVSDFSALLFLSFVMIFVCLRKRRSPYQ